MFARLARNIFISGVAFGLIGFIGLLLAPVLIATYGLAGYGQILLARLVLPNGSLAFLEFGTSETATRIVAAARENREWQDASKALTFLGALILAVIVPFAIGFGIISDDVALWLSIPLAQRGGFVDVLQITAILLPFLFLSLLFEGVLKGYEEFKLQRACEVASALVYAGLAITCVTQGYGRNWVAVSLLVGLTVRFFMATVFALRLLARDGAAITPWDRVQRRIVLEWSRIMLLNKLIGSALGQSAQPLLGFIFGPAAVGAFDAVTRLPKFVKSLLGLLNVVLLPLATGLFARNDMEGVQRLGQVGILAALMVAWPVLGMLMACSQPILELWLGAEVAIGWGWQAAMFIVPMLNMVWSFGASIILSQQSGAVQSTRLTALQAVVQLAISFALISLLGAWAFVMGAVGASVLLSRCRCVCSPTGSDSIGGSISPWPGNSSS